MVLKKKTTKKKTVKKSNSTRPKPKKTTRRKTKKPLEIAPPEKCFWVINGLVIKDLKELAQALQRSITDEEFKTHIDNGNDFARWINEVLGDSSCAKALARMKSRKSAITVINKHLKKYQ